MEKRKILIKELIIILVLLVIIGTLIIFLLGKKSYTSSQMDDKLREMASKFYTEYYYDDISDNRSKKEVTDYLSSFKEKGLKVDLETLSDYDSENNDPIIANFIKDGIECNKNETKAVIYPKSPYGKKDFEIETVIVCD